jgi:hypothetical protein
LVFLLTACPGSLAATPPPLHSPTATISMINATRATEIFIPDLRKDDWIQLVALSSFSNCSIIAALKERMQPHSGHCVRSRFLTF